MNCWHCDRPAQGVCFFCGRGVCKEHAGTMPSLITTYRTKGNELKGVVTKDVLHCGVCTPEGNPVSLDALDEDEKSS